MSDLNTGKTYRSDRDTKIHYYGMSAFQHLTRWTTKNELTDLKKARNYIDLLIGMECKMHPDHTEQEDEAFAELEQRSKESIEHHPMETKQARHMNTSYMDQHNMALEQFVELLLDELSNCGEFTYTTGTGLDEENVHNVAHRKYTITFYDLVTKADTALFESLERHIFSKQRPDLILDAIRTEIEYEVEDLSLGELRVNIEIKKLEVA